MAIEIEAKMKVADLARVRSRLEAVGARRRGLVMEVNTFFDTADSSLLAGDRGLRVRQARDLETGKDLVATITFKGPKQQVKMKSREEIELVVDSASRAAELLEQLGMRRIMAFEKRRESWDCEDCHVELDELPHLGVFVEVEGPSEAAVLRVREVLGLSTEAMIRSSYSAMLMTYMQETGQSARLVRFEAGAE